MYSITEMDDRELFSKLQQGDGKAFEAIYEKYHRLLYSFALRHLESRDMAEDAVQQVFVHLWEIHADIYVNISLRNYLYTMIKNHILNLIRSENTTFVRNYELAEAKQDYCEDLDDKIDKKEQMAMLYKAIASLPEQKRVVCMLKMEGTLTNQEIADKLNISINTVKTHYLQSIQKLKECMSKMLIFLFFITHLLLICVNLYTIG